MLYAVTFVGTCAGQEVNHQRYYDVDIAEPDYQTFANAIGAALKTAVQAATFTQVGYTHLIIRPMIEAGVGSTIVPSGWPFTGTGAGECLPPFVTARLRLNANSAVHPVRGMVQFSGIPESHQNNGVLTSGALPLYETIAEVFVIEHTSTEAGNWVPVLYSDKYERSAEIVSATAMPNLGTQRRRMPGSGS